VIGRHEKMVAAAEIPCPVPQRPRHMSEDQRPWLFTDGPAGEARLVLEAIANLWEYLSDSGVVVSSIAENASVTLDQARHIDHSAHISRETRAYLATRPGRFEYVHTPKHGSWLNLIECAFLKMARTFLRHIGVDSVDELRARLLQGIAKSNDAPVVFRWNWFELDLVDVQGLARNDPPGRAPGQASVPGSTQAPDTIRNSGPVPRRQAM
jgi:hypothetical protein